MIALLRFVATNAWLVSLLCMLGAARLVWRARLTREARAATPYPLERESLLEQTHRAGITAAVLVFLGLVVLAAGPLTLARLAEAPDEDLSRSAAGIFTRTPGPSPTTTPAPPTLAFTLTPTPTLKASPTSTPAPVVQTSTPSPAPAYEPPDCPDPRVRLSAPSTGQLLAGPVEIRGTANIPDFAFYKFEINGPLTQGEWWTIGDLYYAPVSNGLLGRWDATPVAVESPGLYLFRLTAVDKTGNYPSPCTVQVRIARE